MSFILDALKKAESERHRHAGPVLMDARIAPPRRGLPVWAWVLGAVMVVNLALLGWMLLRTPASPIAAAAQQPVATAPVTPPVSAPVASSAPEVSSAAAPAPAPAPLPAPEPFATGPTLMAQPLPAAAPAASTPYPAAAPDTRIEDEYSLPTVPELRAAGVSLPELELNLHVYDPAPSYRSVLLNGNRLREGEYTPDGVKVERITPQAVVLEAAGRRFRLDAGG